MSGGRRGKCPPTSPASQDPSFLLTHELGMGNRHISANRWHTMRLNGDGERSPYHVLEKNTYSPYLTFSSL